MRQRAPRKRPHPSLNRDTACVRPGQLQPKKSCGGNDPRRHLHLRPREDVIVALALNANVVRASKARCRHRLAHPIPAQGLGLVGERASCVVRGSVQASSREARVAVSGRRRVGTHSERTTAGHACSGGIRGSGWRTHTDRGSSADLAREPSSRASPWSCAPFASL